MLRITDVVKNLIIINVIIYFGTMFLSEEIQEWFRLYPPMSDQFEPVQLITHMFSHGGPMHLFFNMFGLFMFGPPLEDLWGPKKFLFFYLVAGFGAAAVHLGINYIEYLQVLGSMDANNIAEVLANGGDIMRNRQQYSDPELAGLNSLINMPVVGASGALYGVLVGYGMNFPNAKLALIFFPVPVAAKYFIPGLLVLDLLGGFTGFSIFGQNIAHFAHVGGAIFGFLMIMYWRKFGSRL
jgi:membrane associated rhomboid family serine protease